MPDWVANELIVTGDKAALNAFRTRAAAGHDNGAVTEAGRVLSFQCLLPTPSDLTQEQQMVWRKQNWGVYSDPVEAVAEIYGNELIFAFETAWNPPLPLVQRISSEETSLRFQLDYRSERSSCDETAVFFRGSQVS